MSSVTTVPVGAAIPSLARWGLSHDADLVFRTLTTFGPRPARTLAGELGLPRPRVDTALSELYEYGAAAAVTTAGKVPSWHGRPPGEVVHRLRMRRFRPPDPSAAVRRHRAVFDTLNTRLTGAGVPLSASLAGTIGDGVRYLPNRSLTRERLAAEMYQERHEHLVINNEEFDTVDVTRAVPYDEAMYRRGVTFRILGQPPLDGDIGRPPEPERTFGVPSYLFRETRDTPLKLFVCDRRVAFVAADPADLERGYLEIRQPEVIRTLVEVFESRWASSVDPGPVGVPAISLTRREHDLVDLLARGHTDVTAAQELRISARSVTNTLRALMDRIGVDNRFQLGLALGAMRVTAPPSLTE
jgi:DNA-binding CsgD family transcriptional regulator